MKNMSTLYQHLRSELVPSRVKSLAAAWQVWNSAQEGKGVAGTIHIAYDGDYGSERVLIISGRATIIPDDGSPSFTVGAGDAVYFDALCTASVAPGAFSKAPSSSATVTLAPMARRSKLTCSHATCVSPFLRPMRFSSLVISDVRHKLTPSTSLILRHECRGTFALWQDGSFSASGVSPSSLLPLRRFA